MKEYQHTGACPILIRGFGRVNPGTRSFICEIDEGDEKFFLQIGAIKVKRENVPAETEPSEPSRPQFPSPAPWPSEVNSDGEYKKQSKA